MTDSSAAEDSDRKALPRRTGQALIALAFIALLVVTLGHDLRVQDVDPQFTRNVVERTDEFGGSFYENGIYNKGPLEPAVHWIGSLVTTDAGYWFAIAGVAGLISLLIAIAGMRTATRAGATPTIAAAVGIATFIALTFSDADYAGVVFVRNLTVSLLAGAWIILIWDDAWSTPRRRTISVIGMTALIGLAVQTLLTSVFAGVVLIGGAWALLRRRAPSWERIKLAGIGFLSLDVAGLSAPAWYWARGSWDEFWASWWIHASYMSSGTGRSLPSQFWLGCQRFFEYHRERPLMTAVVLAFAAVTVARWKTWAPTTRVIAVTAAGWWLAGWFELILSQRYTSHYYSIVAVPIAIMAALVVGWIVEEMRRFEITPWRSAWALVATAVVAVYIAGPTHLIDATKRAASFRGAADRIAEVDKNQGGETRTVRAVLDLVSEPGDPVLGWVQDPWPYLSLDRVSATRFLWRSFLIGEIYLGQTSEIFVLPNTWEWFAEDVAESDPVALIEARDQIACCSPFADLAASQFTEVMSGEVIDLWLRNDVLATLTDPATETTSLPTAAAGIITPDDGRIPIAATCERFDADLSWPEAQATVVVMRFVADEGAHETLIVRLEPSAAVSGSEVVDYLSRDLETRSTRQVSLVVGARAAAVFVDGSVEAALRLPVPVTVDMEVRDGSLVLETVTTGASPVEAGC